MTIQFTKAVRTAAKLKIGIQGPSGSGKTMGALALASALAGDKGVVVLDTESGSAELYSDRFEFDKFILEPPYTSERYQEIIDAAVKSGYGALVIDSISHQWAGSGGILERKEQVDARGGNSFTNWSKFTPEHEAFKAHLLHAPIHIIATLRTKTEYVMESGSSGKQTPKKMGLAPIQREGIEYEFTINFELQMDHKAIASKDRTDLFDSPKGLHDLTEFSTAKLILDWLGAAKAAAVLAPTNGKKMTLADALVVTLPGSGPNSGKQLGDMKIEDIETVIAKITATKKEKGISAKHAELLEALNLVRTDRIKAIATGRPTVDEPDELFEEAR